MKEPIEISRNIWGPMAWHLLHSFSINHKYKLKQNQNHDYYIFYKTFSYILPCLICSEHYQDYFFVHHKMIEKKITRTYLIKWVFELHNKVNKNLDKPTYTLKKCIEDNIEPNNNIILFFINTIYLGYDYYSMDIYRYDYIYNFFYKFCELYPDKKIRKILLEQINTEAFMDVETPMKFYLWYKKYIFKNKHLNKYYTYQETIEK